MRGKSFPEVDCFHTVFIPLFYQNFTGFLPLFDRFLTGAAAGIFLYEWVKQGVREKGVEKVYRFWIIFSPVRLLKSPDRFFYAVRRGRGYGPLL
jgi:hypothetical protein